MKKIICCICCIIAFSMLCSTAFANAVYEYGTEFFSMKMNGEFVGEDYWNIYRGKDACELSPENVYEGKGALKCDISKLDQSQDYPFNMDTRAKANNSGISDNDICFEVYTSSSEEVFQNLTLAVRFAMPDGSERTVKGFVTEQVNENWKRSYLVVNSKSYPGFTSCKVSVLFKKNPALSGCFYIDYINMKVCPVSLKINDVYAPGNVADLKDVRVFGIDHNGKESVLKSNDLVRWGITSGDAEIVDNRVVYHGTEPGDVVLEANFLSKTTTFTMHFENKNISMSSPPVMDGENVVSCTVVNNSDQGTEFSGCILICDVNGLYNAYIVEENIDGGQSATISKKINIPVVLNEPKVKFFYWDGFGDISEIMDVN